MAGAIAHVIREEKRVDVQAIGAAAVYQAIKAIVIARGYLQADGLDLVCLPKFIQLEIHGLERMALKIAVEIRSRVAEITN